MFHSTSFKLQQREERRGLNPKGYATRPSKWASAFVPYFVLTSLQMLEQIARVPSISAGNHLSAWRGLTICTGVMSLNFFDDWSGEDLH